MSGAAAAPATPSAFRSALRPVEQDLTLGPSPGPDAAASRPSPPWAPARARGRTPTMPPRPSPKRWRRLYCRSCRRSAPAAQRVPPRLAESWTTSWQPGSAASSSWRSAPARRRTSSSASPRLMTNQASAKPRRYRHSSTSGVGGVHQEFLEKAFVVNFRRLMIILKVCEIIHELIKSTGIAALTLVGAFNLWELSYSILFVAILMFLFVFNIRRMHTMDGDKYKRLADLLEDDDPDPNTNGGQWRNPNRYLKALMLQRRGRCLRRLGRRRRAFLGTSLVALLCGAAWGLLVWEWATDDAFEDERWGGEESMRFYSALLLIGTLMFLFYVAFEAMYWRETQSVMPMKWDGAKWVPWDVKYDGVPPQFRWFGLPSMWFSSQKAKSDLILWSSLATTTHEQRSAGRTVDKLYPEELAVLSLDSRVIGQLRGALKNAKLFQCESKCPGV
ncbi:unnamed protein product [Prorocentrum cordatum]|uniref:Autophagy-related protein 9 n=1 Tax=Prorocentrum cordatum TaxID=2364126 RepID=A0ABN9RF22_9DINO|nr:unnamed protein product [Polarella glacialis]